MATKENIREVTLSTMAGGAVEELFGDALSTVLRNIDDPNTDAKAKRSITLTVGFHVDEDRRMGQVTLSCATKLAGVKGEVTLSCATKLAGVKGVTTNVYFGRHHGRLAAVEAPNQEQLFPTPDATLRPVTEAAEGGRKE